MLLSVATMTEPTTNDEHAPQESRPRLWTIFLVILSMLIFGLVVERIVSFGVFAYRTITYHHVHQIGINGLMVFEDEHGRFPTLDEIKDVPISVAKKTAPLGRYLSDAGLTCIAIDSAEAPWGLPRKQWARKTRSLYPLLVVLRASRADSSDSVNAVWTDNLHSIVRRENTGNGVQCYVMWADYKADVAFYFPEHGRIIPASGETTTAGGTSRLPIEVSEP